MINRLTLLAALPVFLSLFGPAAAQPTQNPKVNDLLDKLTSAPEDSPAPAPARVPAKAVHHRKARGKPAADPTESDMPKSELADISKVYKSQMAFDGAESELWKNFWTKLRDERALFELRLGKQREGFVDSLRSLDPKDHGQSLLDFETLQNNSMKSFEENHSAKIRDFIAERLAKLKEFGEIQEAERARLAQSSREAWEAERAKLGIALPQLPTPEKGKKGAKSEEKKKFDGMP